MDFIDISAKTVEEAISTGVEQLTADAKEVVETKIIEEPSNGFLGIGKKPAVVRLFYKAVEVPFEKEETVAVENEDNSMDSIDSQVETTPAVPAKGDKEEVEITPEEQAIIADRAKAFLQDMFEKMNLSVLIEKMVSKDKITFQIHGEELGILIGKHGQTLDSIQYLTNLVANKEMAHRCHVVVDVENYRSRREDTLVQLAKRLGSKVRHSRQRIALEPMNAFERKIIHVTLQDEVHIVTDSEGEGPYRHVVISYKK